jgi:hypothetical protein
MADLSITNSFSAGTAIVASQMNTNFSDVTTWANGSPNIGVSGSTATMDGALTVTEALTASSTSQFNGTVTVGVNDTGYDVKFFGATATNGYMLWDESEDSLVLGSSSNIFMGQASTYTFTGSSDGNTFINAATSKATYHRINNATKMVVSAAGVSINNGDGAASAAQLHVIGNAFIQGPDGWNGSGDLAITRLGSGVANEVFGCGYKYGTGMILSVYKLAGGGSFGSNSYDAVTIADVNGGVTVAADFTCNGTKNFDIAHPTKGGDWRLRHAAVEAPRADLIYRGSVTLSGGTATVDLDTASNMTDGTWEALNCNPWAMVASSGNAVEWSLSGKILTVTSDTADAVCSWMVIGERHDERVIGDDCGTCDTNGSLITEYEREAPDPDFQYPSAQEAAETHEVVDEAA